MSTAAQPPTPASPTISGLTLTYLIIDVLFGIVAPILCLIFDPFVFRTADPVYVGTGSIFTPYRVFAYSSIGLGILTLVVWLVVGRRLRQGYGFFAGAFLFGAVFALALGVGLLPFSLLGLFLIIGIFGFTPFLTSVVYGRHGLRALAQLRELQSLKSQLIFGSLMMLGLTVVCTLPLLAQWQVSTIVDQNLQTIITGDTQSAKQSVQILKNAFWCDARCYSPLVHAYQQQKDPARQALLADAYFELTNVSIEFVIQRMAD